MPQPTPVPLSRYALVALLGLGVVMAVVLLVRPFIFSFAEARDTQRLRAHGRASIACAHVGRCTDQRDRLGREWRGNHLAHACR